MAKKSSTAAPAVELKVNMALAAASAEIFGDEGSLVAGMLDGLEELDGDDELLEPKEETNDGVVVSDGNAAPISDDDDGLEGLLDALSAPAATVTAAPIVTMDEAELAAGVAAVEARQALYAAQKPNVVTD